MFVEHKEAGEANELDEPAKLLLKAADLIEKHGLCRLQRGDKIIGFCIAGALAQAAPGQANMDGTPFNLAYRRVGAAVGMPASEWNDYHAKSAAEVAGKLRAVALSG